MNKAIALFLILAGLIAFVNAKNIDIKVGTEDNQNLFVPDTVNAAMGDTVTFTWVSGKHSVVQSDEGKSCAKSAAKDAFFMAATNEVGKTFVVDIKQATGKMWFFCGVQGHCPPMYGTILIGQAADNGTDTGKGAETGKGTDPAKGTGTPSTGASPSDAAASPSGSPKASSASSTYTSAYVVSAGVILSSMCMAAYML